MATLKLRTANGNGIYTFTDLPYRTTCNLEGGRRLRYGSPGASRESKRRAFRNISDILYLYSDYFTTFVTLTFASQHSSNTKCLNYLKNYFSRKGITYVCVFEPHKSGNLHIHAITSDLPGVYFDSRYAQYKWGPWERNVGITDVKFISGVDDRFRIEKYIFKYMAKGSKIGGRYFYKSRNLKFREYSSHRYRGDLQAVPQLWTPDQLDFSETHCYNREGEYSIKVTKEYYGSESTRHKS